MQTRDTTILFLTRYGPLGASSRYRSLQYLPALEASGLRCQVSPLFDDDWVRALSAGRKPSHFMALQAYAGRLLRLLRARKPQLLVVEKELFPFLPAFLERLLTRGQIPYVVDIDDAIFARYQAHPNRLVRQWLGHKIATVQRHASAVIAGNEFLAARAREAGCGRVEVIPTAVDLARYTRPGAGQRPGRVPRVGWIGSPSTAAYLRPLHSVLGDLTRNDEIELMLVGAGPGVLPGLPCRREPWTLEREVELVSEMDIGIMPLTEGDWERGKCGLKLLQYMAASLPVVASPVGANLDIVTAGWNGYLAKDPSEWKDAIRRLATDRKLARQLGANGRRRVSQTYDLAVTTPRYVTLILRLLDERYRTGGGVARNRERDEGTLR